MRVCTQYHDDDGGEWEIEATYVPYLPGDRVDPGEGPYLEDVEAYRLDAGGGIIAGEPFALEDIPGITPGEIDRIERRLYDDGRDA